MPEIVKPGEIDRIHAHLSAGGTIWQGTYHSPTMIERPEQIAADGQGYRVTTTARPNGYFIIADLLEYLPAEGR